MFWSLSTITLSLLTLVTYNCLQIYSQYQDVWFKDGYSLNVLTCIGYSLEVLIFISITLDLYKWGTFLIATKTEQTQQYEEQIKKSQRRLFALLISVIILVVLSFTGLFIAIITTTYLGPFSWDQPNEKIQFVTTQIISLIFLIYLVVYIVTLTILITRLKKRYGNFYK